MAHSILFLRRKLGKSEPERRDDKERIITESACPTLFAGDNAVALAAHREEDLRSGFSGVRYGGKRGDTDEVRRAEVVSDVGKLGDQLSVVRGTVRVGVRVARRVP